MVYSMRSSTIIIMCLASTATAIYSAEPGEVLNTVAKIQRGIASSNLRHALPPNRNWTRNRRFLKQFDRNKKIHIPSQPASRNSSSSSSSSSASNSDTDMYIKASCVKGQATSIPDLEETGTYLVIPSGGYCLNAEAASEGSTLLTCDGKIFFIIFLLFLLIFDGSHINNTLFFMYLCRHN